MNLCLSYKIAHFFAFFFLNFISPAALRNLWAIYIRERSPYWYNILYVYIWIVHAVIECVTLWYALLKRLRRDGYNNGKLQQCSATWRKPRPLAAVLPYKTLRVGVMHNSSDIEITPSSILYSWNSTLRLSPTSLFCFPFAIALLAYILYCLLLTATSAHLQVPISLSLVVRSV